MRASEACRTCPLFLNSITYYMTQDERWNIRYQEVMEFIETNHRNPSKYRIEEHEMLNWLKANRKALNAGKMKADRIEKFNELLQIGERYKHVNQYV